MLSLETNNNNNNNNRALAKKKVVAVAAGDLHGAALTSECITDVTALWPLLMLAFFLRSRGNVHMGVSTLPLFLFSSQLTHTLYTATAKMVSLVTVISR